MQNNCRNAFPNKFNASQTMRDLSKIGESPVDMSHRLFILVPVEMSQTNSTFYIFKPLFSSFGFFQ